MTEKDTVVVKNKRYKLVPPDGGWGYMIWIAVIINFSAGTMFMGCFGLLFNEIIVKLSMGSTRITLLSGIDCMSLSVMGYLTGPLLKLMSLRKVAFLGSLMFNLGVFLTVFATTQVELFIYQGLLQYGGFGILCNLSSSLINDYFVKKLFLSVSLTQTIPALSAMVAPQFVKWSLEVFGFRGTLLLISAISLHSFIAVAIMQPVEWHMIKVDIANDPGELMVLLMEEKIDNSKCMRTPTITLTKIDSSFDDKVGKTDLDNNVPGEKSENEFQKLFSEMWDMDVMKKFFKSNSTIGPPIALAFEGLYCLMLPQALYSMGWDQNTVAKAISLFALGDLATRLSFTFFSKWFMKVGSQEIYVIGLAIAVASRLVMMWSENVTVILICITIMGIPNCTILVLPPLIIADSFTSSQFTSAMGIFLMSAGVLNIIVGPAIGAVRDTTDSYPTAFYIITSCFSVLLLMWTIELVYKKNRHRRKLQEIARNERALKKNKSKA